MPPRKQKNASLKVTSAIVVILAVVLLTITSNATRAQQTSQTVIASSQSSSRPSSSTSVATATSTSSTNTSSGYKDGTYVATSDYYVPHGSEEIQVNITLKNGVITGTSIENSEYDGESAQYQEGFASEYKTYVIGKKISGLGLSYVSGASDTTQGFNDALSKIRTEAES
jgi:uncharacterized protein with FMN-binding domain